MQRVFLTVLAIFVGLFIGVSGGPFAGPAAAQVNAARAEQACIGAANRLLMIHRRTLSTSVNRDSRGRVIGSTLRMDVRFLGRPTEVTCVYDAIASSAVVEFGSNPGSGIRPVPPADVMRVCRREAQTRRYRIESVAAETPITNRQRQVTGRLVVFNIVERGRWTQLHCSFDYATRDVELAQRRPQPR